MLKSAETEDHGLINREIIPSIPTWVTMIPQRYRRTERQTTCRGNTVFCVASCSIKYTH